MICGVTSSLDGWVEAVEITIESAGKVWDNRDSLTVTFDGRTAKYKVDSVEETFNALIGLETRTFHLSLASPVLMNVDMNEPHRHGEGMTATFKLWQMLAWTAAVYAFGIFVGLAHEWWF